jgi:polysaccharide biosynthesis protein PelG
MAGIGFGLREFSRHEGLARPTLAVSHAAFVASGPSIFTILSLAIIHQSTTNSLSATASYTFRGVVIYAFTFSLLITAPFFNVAIRQLADDLFVGCVERVSGRFAAALLFSVWSALIVSISMYALVAVSAIDFLSMVAATTAAAVIWPALSFCQATRDYRSVTGSFVVGLSIAVAGTIAGACSGWSPAEMVGAFCLGLVVTFFCLVRQILATFPCENVNVTQEFVSLFFDLKRYSVLAIGSAAAVAAIWIDKWIMWFGPMQISLDNGLINAPFYDGAMFIAYLSLIPGLGLFLISVDVTFQQSLTMFFNEIREGATLYRIEENCGSLRSRTYTSIGEMLAFQTFVCLAAVMLSPLIVPITGLLYEQIGVLRTGLVAAEFQFLFIIASTLILYLDRHERFLALQIIFLILQAGGTIASITFGPASYGYGHLVACAVSSLIAAATLENTLENLPRLSFQSARRPAKSRSSQQISAKPEREIHLIHLKAQTR